MTAAWEGQGFPRPAAAWRTCLVALALPFNWRAKQHAEGATGIPAGLLLPNAEAIPRAEPSPPTDILPNLDAGVHPGESSGSAI
jgi:hypothetical protein